MLNYLIRQRYPHLLFTLTLRGDGKRNPNDTLTNCFLFKGRKETCQTFKTLKSLPPLDNKNSKVLNIYGYFIYHSIYKRSYINEKYITLIIYNILFNV